MVGEVFPLAVRGQASAVATMTNFASNFGVRAALLVGIVQLPLPAVLVVVLKGMLFAVILGVFNYRGLFWF